MNGFRARAVQWADASDPSGGAHARNPAGGARGRRRGSARPGPGRGDGRLGRGAVAALGWWVLHRRVGPAAHSAGDVWIAGQYFDAATSAQEPFIATAVGHNTTPNGPTKGIILSWTGSAWTNVAVPKVGATEQLYATSAVPGGSLTWAFGRSTGARGVVHNLTLRNG